jgi:hypothetical protein
MSARTRIFLLSFTLLFFELLCIRWIPAYVRYLSYFTNHSAGVVSRYRTGIFGAPSAVSLPFVPNPARSLTIVVVLITELHIASTDVFYFGPTGTTGHRQSFVLAAHLHVCDGCFYSTCSLVSTLFIRRLR